MALVTLIKRFEKCMNNINKTDCNDCPLLNTVRLEIGNSSDEHGHISWDIQGCSLVLILSDNFKENRNVEKVKK